LLYKAIQYKTISDIFKKLSLNTLNTKYNILSITKHFVLYVNTSSFELSFLDEVTFKGF